jgi:seryl-tRNA synthetase
MFNLFETVKLKREITELESRIAARDEDINKLQFRIKQLEHEKIDTIKADVNSSEFKIDWSKMDAFSIERMGDHQSAYTVIGYYMTDENNVKHVHEWKFYCSQEQHNKLAGEFNGTA